MENTQSIVDAFVTGMVSESGAVRSLEVNVSNFGALRLRSATSSAAGLEWNISVSKKQFDIVVIDLPFGTGRESYTVGGEVFSIRKNWIELAKALRLVVNSGYCLALIEPSAFGIQRNGPDFLSALEAEGYFLRGFVNAPENLLKTTTVRPVIAVFCAQKTKITLAGELENEEQARALARILVLCESGNSLLNGIEVNGKEFSGFESLRAVLQLEKLESQYKEYESVRLVDIAVAINTVRQGETHIVKENAIYIPAIGNFPVTHEISELSIKHHNVLQVELSERAVAGYVAAYFRSELGSLAMRSLAVGAWIRRLRKSDLSRAPIALPPVGEQREILESHNRLTALSLAIAVFQDELALNPKSATSVRSQVENMLAQIGELSDSDRVMAFARQGESATLEFKETFALNVRKDERDDDIELSALKTIVAFLNSRGGTLLIGVADSGEITGVEYEVSKCFKKGLDGYLLHFKNRLKGRIGEQFYPYVDQKLVKASGLTVLMVICEKSPRPCYLDRKDFYVRTNPATDKLIGPTLVEYVRNHFGAY